MPTAFMIDSHCHIYLEQFKEDLLQVLERAAEAEVNKILMPAINRQSLAGMERISHSRISFYKMVGIHPTEINEVNSTTEQELFDLCKSDEIIAVGETGLDYYWSSNFKSEQKISLRLHCQIAKQTGKPIVLHNRESTDDLLDIIEEEQDGRLTGVWHCFNGSVEEGRRAIDLGLNLGIGGVLTFKNADVDKTVSHLPLDNMLLETDAPYLSPEPNRGKRNEPSFLKYIAQKLAEVKNCSLENIQKTTSDNAIKLFGLG